MPQPIAAARTIAATGTNASARMRIVFFDINKKIGRSHAPPYRFLYWLPALLLLGPALAAIGLQHFAGLRSGELLFRHQRADGGDCLAVLVGDVGISLQAL